MKGIVFNLLEELVVREHGEATWDTLLADASLDGAFTSLGNYDDRQLMAIVAAAAKRLSMAPGEVVRWFGREALPMFAKRYPQFFEAHSATSEFLLTLNDVIHPEVLKLYPGAAVPVFEYELQEDGALRMRYLSQKRLCDFAHGLIQGAARHFGETVRIEQEECSLRGDQSCLFVLAFERAAT